MRARGCSSRAVRRSLPAAGELLPGRGGQARCRAAARACDRAFVRPVPELRRGAPRIGHAGQEGRGVGRKPAVIIGVVRDMGGGIPAGMRGGARSTRSTTDRAGAASAGAAVRVGDLGPGPFPASRRAHARRTRSTPGRSLVRNHAEPRAAWALSPDLPTVDGRAGRAARACANPNHTPMAARGRPHRHRQGVMS